MTETITTPVAPDNGVEDFFTSTGFGRGLFNKDDPPGTVKALTITSMVKTQQTRFGDNEPLFWDDGTPRMQLVITGESDQQDPLDPDDDGVRSLYVRGSTRKNSASLHDAARAALENAGVKTFTIGGTLEVTFTGTVKRGSFDAKTWSMLYIPAPAQAEGLPAPTPNRVSPPPPQTQTQTSPQQFQAAVPHPPVTTQQIVATPEAVAAVKAAGLNPADILPGYTE